MFWGDIMHAASVQFPEPDVAINFDIAPKTAVITRQKLLRDAAAQRYWVALDHVSFPGIGHVRAEKVGWSWAPINYSDDGTGQWKNQLPPADVWRQLANREAQDLETLNSKSKKAVKNGGAAKQHRKRRPIGVASAMTPLQYQKQLRLQEARRLMSSEGLDAARAGYAVGYGDPSYFSRDYKRVFGEPPRQHAARGHSEVW